MVEQQARPVMGTIHNVFKFLCIFVFLLKCRVLQIEAASVFWVGFFFPPIPGHLETSVQIYKLQ